MNVLLSSQESVKQESPSISLSNWVDERQVIDELNKQNLVSLSLRTPAEIQTLLEKNSWN